MTLNTWGQNLPRVSILYFVNGNSIWERLDRELATNGWFLKVPGSQVYHWQCDSSNHRPLLIVFAPLDFPSKKKPFLI